MRYLIITMVACLVCSLNTNAQPGTALGFNGNGDYIRIPHDETLDPDHFTLEAWVCPNIDFRRGQGLIPVWISKQISNQHPERGYNLYYDSRGNLGHICAYLSVGNGYHGINHRTDMDRDTWYHVAATHDGEEQHIYLNGEIVATGDQRGDMQGTGQELNLAKATDPNRTYFNGIMDEVRIWNYARSEEEINQTMNRCLNGDEEGLVAYWNFNEGEGNTLHDLTDNHNDGELVGNPNWVESTAPLGSSGILEISPEQINLGVSRRNDEELSLELILRNIVDEEDERSRLTYCIRQPNEDVNWLTFEPDSGEIEAGDSVIVHIAMETENLQLGDNSAELNIYSDGQPPGPIRFSVSVFIVEGFGRMSGYVIDVATGDSLPEVQLQLEGIRYEIETDSSGWFVIDTIPAWNYEITVEEDDYLPYHTQIEIEDGEDLDFNIELLFAACEVNPQEFTLDIRPDSSLEIEITVFNPGNGPLDLTIDKRFPDIGDYDPWDQRRTIDAAVQCGDNCLQGIEFDGENFYISGSNNHEGCGKIHIFSRQGIYINSFDQFEDSNWGMRDLAWDGSLLWGADGSSIFVFTPEGALEDLINAPLERVRAITWDEANELLWVCDTESDMVGIDQEGFTRVTFRRNHEHRIFGLATFPEDPDGYTIYAFCLDGEYDTQVNKMNPETGEWLFVADLETGDDFMAGGVCITCRWDPMAWSFVGILRGSDQTEDVFGIWHVASRTNWINLNSESETVPPEDEIMLPVMLDATGFDHDTDLECELIIEHNGRGDRVRIPVTVQVTLVVDDKPDMGIPRSFHLSNPYPNPFNDATSIRFDLPSNNFVSLNLIDIHGRSVKKIINGYYQAGYHNTIINGDNLASGVYFLNMQAGNNTAIKKILLVR